LEFRIYHRQPICFFLTPALAKIQKNTTIQKEIDRDMLKRVGMMLDPNSMVGIRKEDSRRAYIFHPFDNDDNVKDFTKKYSLFS